MAEQTVTVGVGALSIEDVIAVARGGAKVAISDESKHEMALSRAVIDHLADDTVPHYGISTGFGALASTSIPKEQRAQLQKSLIRSHAAVPDRKWSVRWCAGLLVLRLSTLCTGRTGVRPETAQVYADMLNAGITPVVYEYGSLGWLRVIWRRSQPVLWWRWVKARPATLTASRSAAAKRCVRPASRPSI